VPDWQQFKPFTKTDWYGLAGCEDFVIRGTDGSKDIQKLPPWILYHNQTNSLWILDERGVSMLYGEESTGEEVIDVEIEYHLPFRGTFSDHYTEAIDYKTCIELLLHHCFAAYRIVNLLGMEEV
jgi:hypothetical protein